MEISKMLDRRLIREFGASGKGLGEKAQSVASQLPILVQVGIERLAAIRNKLVHEEQSNFPILIYHRKISREYFEALSKEVIDELDRPERLRSMEAQLTELQEMQSVVSGQIAAANAALDKMIRCAETLRRDTAQARSAMRQRPK